MLTGFGLQFWNLSTLKYPERVVEIAKRTGCSWVSVKVTDGPWLFYDPANHLKFYKDTIAALRKEGIAVNGWGYHYGRKRTRSGYQHSPEKDVRAVLRAYELLDLDKVYFIDAEVEWRETNKPGDAHLLTEPLNKAGLETWLESWKYPMWHTRMRYPEWAAVLTGGWAPQVYWMGRNEEPAKALERSLREHIEFGPDLPFVPIGPLFSEGGWSVKAGELVEIANWAKRNGFAFGLWKGEYLAPGAKGRKLLNTVADISKYASRRVFTRKIAKPKVPKEPVLSNEKPQEQQLAAKTKPETAPATEVLRFLILGKRVEFNGKRVADVSKAHVVFSDGSRLPASKLLAPGATIEIYNDSRVKRETKEYVVTARALLIRSTPVLKRDKSNVVGWLPYGAHVEVFEERNGWARIGDNRWVSKLYLREV